MGFDGMRLELGWDCKCIAWCLISPFDALIVNGWLGMGCVPDITRCRTCEQLQLRDGM